MNWIINIIAFLFACGLIYAAVALLHYIDNLSKSEFYDEDEDK